MDYIKRKFFNRKAKSLYELEQQQIELAKGSAPCYCGNIPIVIKKNDKQYEIGCVAHTTRQITFRGKTVEDVIEQWNTKPH